MSAACMDWLGCVRPCIDGSAGARVFSTPVINPLRVIYDHELFMFSSGAARMVVEEREYCCPAHSYIIIPPGVKHISYVDSREPVLVHWAHFDWGCTAPRESGIPNVRYLPAKIEPDLVRKAPAIVPAGVLYGTVPGPDIYELHARVSELYQSANQRDRALSGAVFLQELIQLLVPATDGTSARDLEAQLAGRTRERLTRLANRPFAQTGSIKAELSALGRSYYHLARVFRRTYGVSPLEYVNGIRAAGISELLRHTDMSVSEIAYEVGFEDLSYFSRFVRKHLGVSPRGFRRRCFGPIDADQNIETGHRETEEGE